MELIVGGRNPHTVTTVRCANCGALKGDVNHWWVISFGGDLFANGELFTCEPFGDKLWSLEPDAMPVCGSACAQRKFEQFLGMENLKHGKDKEDQF